MEYAMGFPAFTTIALSLSVSTEIEYRHFIYYSVNLSFSTRSTLGLTKLISNQYQDSLSLRDCIGYSHIPHCGGYSAQGRHSVGHLQGGSQLGGLC